MKRLISIVFLMLLSSAVLPGSPDIETAKESVVKVFVTKNTPNYLVPWQSKKISRSSGSGAVIAVGESTYIITSAHVVNDASFIEVRNNDQGKRYRARVKWESHATDLALLEVEETSFFNGTIPLSLGGLPRAGDLVTALGYPMGGDDLSTTLGVVSRIEHRRYSHSGESFLTIQIDTPINPGNSGGPIVNSEGAIVGIAMQIITQANNIGYIVPTTVIDHFLVDVSDGVYDGMPHPNFEFETLENTALKQYLQIGEGKSGVLVKTVNDTSGPLQPGDILLSVNSKIIEADGKLRTDYGRQFFLEEAFRKQVGETLSVTLMRNGMERQVDLELKPKISNLPFEFNVRPRFILFGGVVFVPLTQNLINELKASRSSNQIELAAKLETFAQLNPFVNEIVVAQKILPHKQNSGYRANFDVVTKLNGANINGLKQLQVDLKRGEEFNVIEFFDGSKLVFDSKLVSNADSELKRDYGIMERNN